MEIKFAKGAFDSFDGTQEELDQLVKEITEMVESGELIENLVEIDLDELQETDPELLELLFKQISDGSNKLN